MPSLGTLQAWRLRAMSLPLCLSGEVKWVIGIVETHRPIGICTNQADPSSIFFMADLNWLYCLTLSVDEASLFNSRCIPP